MNVDASARARRAVVDNRAVGDGEAPPSIRRCPPPPWEPAELSLKVQPEIEPIPGDSIWRAAGGAGDVARETAIEQVQTTHGRAEPEL